MRQVTSPAEMGALLAAAPPWAYAVGALPDAPPNTLIWFRPMTCGEAGVALAEAMLRDLDDYTDASGQVSIVAGAVMVDLRAPLAPDGESPRLTDPDSLTPLLTPDTAAALGPAGLGALRGGLLEATGYRDWQMPAPPEYDPAAYGERMRHHGYWVDGWHPGDPEAAVWVRGYTEGEAQAAQAYARSPLGFVNPADLNPPLLADCVRCGPGGPPIMTKQQARNLPWGGAELLFEVATRITYAGGNVRVSFQDQPGGGRLPRLVDCDAPRQAAV